MDVSVIIVNYNTYLLTLNCIESIYKYTSGVEFEIIVVDNNSIDRRIIDISSSFPDVKIFALDDNVGFGRANNFGFEKANGNFIFFLNSDTLLLNNSIKYFHDFFIDYSNKFEIGALGSILLDSNSLPNIKNSYSSFPSFFNLITTIFKNFFGFSRYCNSILARRVSTKGFAEVDFVIGADLFISRNVIESHSLFDPNFFLYWEEVDLQLRYKLDSLKVLLIEGPLIIHLEGSSSNDNLKKLNQELKSFCYYLKKNNSPFDTFFVLFIRVITTCLSIIFFRIRPKVGFRVIQLITKYYFYH
jgi:GT2 family glycosyltransferase